MTERPIERLGRFWPFRGPRRLVPNDPSRTGAPGHRVDELDGELDPALTSTGIDLEHADLDVERHVRGDGASGDADAPDRSRVLEGLHDPRLHEAGEPVRPLGMRERRQRAVRSANQHAVRIERLHRGRLGHDELTRHVDRSSRGHPGLRQIEGRGRWPPAAARENQGRKREGSELQAIARDA